MSHFAVLVIGRDAEKQLAPYDENLELPMHVYKTKERMIEYEKNWREEYKESVYKMYLKDKDAYKASHDNPKHIEYLEKGFPKILEMTDEELYQKYIEEYKSYIEEDKQEGNPARYAIDSKGNLMSIFNERAKWDYYCLGGRYAGRLILKEGCRAVDDIAKGYEGEKELLDQFLKERRCNKAFKKDIENYDTLSCFAVVKNYEWFERGQMGWWACVSNDKEEQEWRDEIKKLLADVPDDELISFYDCHI